MGRFGVAPRPGPDAARFFRQVLDLEADVGCWMLAWPNGLLMSKSEGRMPHRFREPPFDFTNIHFLEVPTYREQQPLASWGDFIWVIWGEKTLQAYSSQISALGNSDDEEGPPVRCDDSLAVRSRVHTVPTSPGSLLA